MEWGGSAAVQWGIWAAGQAGAMSASLLSPAEPCCACWPVATPQGLSSKDVKFACKERAALLSLLYRGIELAVARGSCGLGPTLLG